MHAIAHHPHQSEVFLGELSTIIYDCTTMRHTVFCIFSSLGLGLYSTRAIPVQCFLKAKYFMIFPLCKNFSLLSKCYCMLAEIYKWMCFLLGFVATSQQMPWEGLATLHINKQMNNIPGVWIVVLAGQYYNVLWRTSFYFVKANVVWLMGYSMY